MSCSNCGKPKNIVASIIQKSTNIVVGYTNKITGNITDDAKRRISICKTRCSSKTTIFGIVVCKQCGCPIDIKALVEKEFCKLNKW